MVWLRSSRLTALVGGGCQGFDSITLIIVILGNVLETEGGTEGSFKAGVSNSFCFAGQIEENLFPSGADR